LFFSQKLPSENAEHIISGFVLAVITVMDPTQQEEFIKYCNQLIENMSVDNNKQDMAMVTFQ
jgi:hypothetical protein